MFVTAMSLHQMPNLRPSEGATQDSRARSSHEAGTGTDAENPPHPTDVSLK